MLYWRERRRKVRASGDTGGSLLGPLAALSLGVRDLRFCGRRFGRSLTCVRAGLR